MCEEFAHVYVCDFARVCASNELCMEGCLGMLSGVLSIRVIILPRVLFHFA